MPVLFQHVDQEISSYTSTVIHGGEEFIVKCVKGILEVPTEISGLFLGRKDLMFMQAKPNEVMAENPPILISKEPTKNSVKDESEDYQTDGGKSADSGNSENISAKEEDDEEEEEGFDSSEAQK